MPLTHDQIKDLVQNVVNALGPMQFTQLAQKLRQYHVYPTMFRGESGEVKFQTKSSAGTGWEDRVLLKPSGNARNVGLWEPDTINVVDGTDVINGTWAHTTTDYAFEDHEIEMNASGKQALLSLIKTRREQAFIDLAEILEDNFFGCPASASDKITPWGLFYWVTYKSDLTTSAVTKANIAFDGGYAIGSDCAGLAHANWQNLNGNYKDVNGTNKDLIGKLRRAYKKVGWRSPLGNAEYGKTFQSRLKLFCNSETCSETEELMESKNDNLSREVAPLYGRTCFHGFPFIPIEKLDEKTENPIYGINDDTFTMLTLNGFMNRESAPKDVPNVHTASVVYVDNSYNWKCTDRRRNFVLVQSSGNFTD